jgi:hypothetical protein
MRVQIWNVFINLWIAMAINFIDDKQIIKVIYQWWVKVEYELTNEEREITVLPKLIKYLNEK